MTDWRRHFIEGVGDLAYRSRDGSPVIRTEIAGAHRLQCVQQILQRSGVPVGL